jgi:parvulin-like peptidyl-prolyl isomerase
MEGTMPIAAKFSRILGLLATATIASLAAESPGPGMPQPASSDSAPLIQSAGAQSAAIWERLNRLSSLTDGPSSTTNANLDSSQTPADPATRPVSGDSQKEKSSPPTLPFVGLGEEALAALKPDDVVAKVGSTSIRYKQVSPIVKMRMTPILAAAKTPAERQALERAYLDPLTKNVIDQMAFNKRLYLEFHRNIPEEIRSDTRKSLELDGKLQKQIRKQFEAFLIACREKVAAASPEELQSLEKQDSAMVRLALLMKDRHLDSFGELDNVLQEYGTTLEQQINDFGEYMMGMEAARSALDKERVVTDSEMREYYEEHSADYFVSPKAKFQILTAKFASFNDDRKAARNLAEKMAEEVRSGKQLSEVALQSSQEPHADQGGFYDWVSRKSLASNAIDEALFSLDVGTLSDIIEDETGCHIVRVIDRTDGRQLPYAEAQLAIRETIAAQKKERFVQRYLKELRSPTQIWTIYDKQ